MPVTSNRALPWATAIFLLGIAAIFIPTMFDVARLTWTTEQGGHAPIIVGTGGWPLWREYKAAEGRVRLRNAFVGPRLFGVCIVFYVVPSIVATLEIAA